MTANIICTDVCDLVVSSCVCSWQLSTIRDVLESLCHWQGCAHVPGAVAGVLAVMACATSVCAPNKTGVATERDAQLSLVVILHVQITVVPPSFVCWSRLRCEWLSC